MSALQLVVFLSQVLQMKNN